MKKSLFLFLALLRGACWPNSTDADQLQILMVGNSFTREPAEHFRGFLDADPGLIGSTVTVISPGGESWLGHYMTPSTVAALTETDWDVVILNEASLIPSCASLLPDPPPDISKSHYETRQFSCAVWYHDFWLGGRGLSDALTSQNPDADLVYFSTWVDHRDDDRLLLTEFSGSPELMQAHKNASYESLSSEYPGSRMAPVGDAWLESYNQRPEFRLHGPDNHHGNTKGYYLAGAVLYEVVTGTSSVGSEYIARLGEEDAVYLQGIATATTQVPEPSTLFLAGIGVTGLLGYVGRRNYLCHCRLSPEM